VSCVCERQWVERERGGAGCMRRECGESESCVREIVVHERVCVYTWDSVSQRESFAWGESES